MLLYSKLWNLREQLCLPFYISSKIESIVLPASEMKCQQPKGDIDPAVTLKIILTSSQSWDKQT